MMALTARLGTNACVLPFCCLFLKRLSDFVNSIGSDRLVIAVKRKGTQQSRFLFCDVDWRRAVPDDDYRVDHNNKDYKMK